MGFYMRAFGGVKGDIVFLLNVVYTEALRVRLPEPVTSEPLGIAAEPRLALPPVSMIELFMSDPVPMPLPVVCE